MASLSVSFFTFFAAVICLISVIQAANNGGITVDLIHRDSPISPFYNASESFADRFRKSIERSNNRYSWLKSAVMKEPAAIEAPIKNGGFEYLMKIRIGTPPVDVVAIADTGSDLTWIQSKPCINCYPQDAPLFDPKKSSSFKQALCTGGFCRSLRKSGSDCDNQNRCLYEINYGDQSYTRGTLGKENFLFNSSSGRPTTFRDLAFGCSTDSNGTFPQNAAGIIGLGGGGTSIVRQLGGSAGGVFSYCLTSIGSDVASKISFGRDALVKGPGLQKTPMVTQDTFYYLNLEAISVGKTRIENTVSKSDQTDAGNIIIDSGTTLTYLPTDLYNKLITTLKRAIGGTPVPTEGLELCFDKGSVTNFPPITMHFTGADVRLSEKGTFVSAGRNDDKVCAMFSEDSGLGLAIFGNLHQIDYKIGYDIDGQELGFLPTDCSRLQ